MNENITQTAGGSLERERERGGGFLELNDELCLTYIFIISLKQAVLLLSEPFH